AALRRKTEPSYMGTFTGARRYVLDTFANTQSPLMKRRVARFMSGAPCPTCGGRRLKRESLSVTFAGLDIGTLSRLPLASIAEVLTPAAQGRFDEPVATTTRSRAAGRKDIARRVAAGGLPHTGGTDVRRTANLSEEKRIAAQRISQDLIERIASLQALG
ncbi:excinuclease ABC subunit A, partial [Kosakonia sp. H7A]